MNCDKIHLGLQEFLHQTLPGKCPIIPRDHEANILLSDTNMNIVSQPIFNYPPNFTVVCASALGQKYVGWEIIFHTSAAQREHHKCPWRLQPKIRLPHLVGKRLETKSRIWIYCQKTSNDIPINSSFRTCHKEYGTVLGGSKCTLATATSICTNRCTGVYLRARFILRCCGDRAHSVLDLCSHCHKGLLDIGSIFSTGFQEWYTKLVSILLKWRD